MSFVDFVFIVMILVGLILVFEMEGRFFLGNEFLFERRFVFVVRDRVDDMYEMFRVVVG